MKIKPTIFYILSLLMGVFRIFVVQNYVEAETGFYKESTVIPVIYTALLVVLIVFMGIYAFFKYRRTTYDIMEYKGGAVACFSYILVGITLLFSAVVYYIKYTQLTKLDLTTAPIKYTILLMITALVAGISIILMAFYHITSKKDPSISLFMLPLIAWFGVSLIGTFKTYTTIITISEYLHVALSMTAVLLFSFYSAKSYVDNTLGFRLVFTGLICFLSISVTAIPHIYFVLTKSPVFYAEPIPDFYVLAAMLLYIPITIYMVNKGVNKK